MRWFSLLLVLPACDPTLAPDPPTVIASHVDAVSIGYGHTLIVATPEGGIAGHLTSYGAPIPSPDASGDGAADPVSPPALVDVAAGQRHACGLSTTGTVHCWGDHTGGALGPHRTCAPPTTEGGMPICILGVERMPALPPIRELTAGDDVTCATLVEGDRVICWGDRRRTGGSSVAVLDPPTPVKLPGGALLAAKRMLAFDGAVCAIDHGQALWCWGDGFGAAPQRQPEVGVLDLAIGPHHGCIIDAQGLRCWGDNRNGQVGDFAAARACPLELPCTTEAPYHVDLDAARVVVGERHTCVLDHDGVVTCFGSNELGQLGRDDAFLVGDRGPVMSLGAPLDGVTELVSAGTFTCALRTLRGPQQLWCWGANPMSVQ
jgi:alpha-tubulin suppressor-like RCC1 family protein